MDRSTTTPFLIRVFPYVVMKDDIPGLPEQTLSAPIPEGRKGKVIGAAGLPRAYRNPNEYGFVFSGEPTEKEEIRIYTYSDASLSSLIEQIKEEMGKRGMLKGVPSDAKVGISVAAAWEEWHRNEARYFMRCRSVGKQGMGEAWARAANAGELSLEVDPRGFPDRTAQSLRELKWNVGDAMDVCFIVC